MDKKKTYDEFDKRMRRAKAIEKVKQQKNYNLDKTPISLSFLERRRYVNPLNKVGYVINIKNGTIDGSNVKDNDKGNRELNAKIMWLCMNRKFEEL